MSTVAPSREIQLPVGAESVSADLTVPPEPAGIVVFAHGSGSSRRSPRNRQVAEALQGMGLATLLLDLLTPSEEQRDLVTREHRFDIESLADRLLVATRWIAGQDGLAYLRIAYFGASTGAAAALIAAARLRNAVGAVVSRGGRPDLAGKALAEVAAPTLLIVGGDDTAVIELNEEALHRMRCERALAIVPGASHLFEEHGTLERVNALAGSWLGMHLHHKHNTRA
jgi:pimeloyl-ACP methyl ester carboxylesterase